MSTQTTPEMITNFFVKQNIIIIFMFAIMFCLIVRLYASIGARFSISISLGTTFV